MHMGRCDDGDDGQAQGEEHALSLLAIDWAPAAPLTRTDRPRARFCGCMRMPSYPPDDPDVDGLLAAATASEWWALPLLDAALLGSSTGACDRRERV